MNELLINRLRTARTDKNMKQQEVADILGIKPNTLSNWEKGRTEPDIDTFVKLCDIYEIDCASLLADVYAFKRIKSDISLAEYDMVKQYRFISKHSLEGKETVDYILNREYKVAEMIRDSSTSKDDNIVPMRLISYYYKNASAGTGQLIIDNLPEKDIEIPDLPEYKYVSYAIGVNGSSMEPFYQDGDILLVEATREIHIGDIGIFQIDNQCYVKKLGENELISINKDYDNIPLNESARTMGKVIGKL